MADSWSRFLDAAKGGIRLKAVTDSTGAPAQTGDTVSRALDDADEALRVVFSGSALLWTSVALQNSWVSFGAGYGAAQYMRDANGIVHLRGVIKDGTATAGTLLFTLPAGFRPPSKMLHLAASPTIEGIQIDTDGTVKLDTDVTNTFLSLDSIHFSVTA